jgi:hypothetical protein
MNTPTFMPSTCFVPGTILRVVSLRFPAVKHWGIVDWHLDENGQPRMWHAQKGDVLRSTDFAYFSSGQVVEILWKPESYEKQVWIIDRLRSKEGLKWNLLSANCEQIVRWAVEGQARSDQLEIGFISLLATGLVIMLASGSKSG